MDALFDLVYVEGELLQTMVRLCILFFAFDFFITFAGTIKSIKESVL